MRLLCIDKSKFTNQSQDPFSFFIVEAAIARIQEGEVYTFAFNVGMTYICIAEFPDIYWEKEGFAPVSDIEDDMLTEQEAEQIRKRQKQLQ